MQMPRRKNGRARGSRDGRFSGWGLGAALVSAATLASISVSACAVTKPDPSTMNLDGDEIVGKWRLIKIGRTDYPFSGTNANGCDADYDIILDIDFDGTANSTSTAYNPQFILYENESCDGTDIENETIYTTSLDFITPDKQYTLGIDLQGRILPGQDDPVDDVTPDDDGSGDTSEGSDSDDNGESGTSEDTASSSDESTESGESEDESSTSEDSSDESTGETGDETTGETGDTSSESETDDSMDTSDATDSTESTSSDSGDDMSSTESTSESDSGMDTGESTTDAGPDLGLGVPTTIRFRFRSPSSLQGMRGQKVIELQCLMGSTNLLCDDIDGRPWTFKPK